MIVGRIRRIAVEKYRNEQSLFVGTTCPSSPAKDTVRAAHLDSQVRGIKSDRILQIMHRFDECVSA